LVDQKKKNLRSKPDAPQVDPSSMMGPMQSQAVFYLSNIGFLFLVQSLFTGFVLVKLPFSLTARFRSVTQRDVAHSLELLDPSLVTSFSWYMMCLYGCQGIITLVLGGKSSEFADQSQMMMNQMGMMGGGGQQRQQWNAAAAFKAEKEQLKIAPAGPVALIASEAALVESSKTGEDVEAVARRQAEAAVEAAKKKLRSA